PAKPLPEPAPQKHREPDPPKVIPKSQKADPESLEAKTDSKHRKPEVSTTIVTRKSNNASTSKATSADTEKKTQERQLAAARQKAAKQLTTAAQRIGESTSSATTIEQEYGPGTGGPAYANYAAWVKTVYENAWEAPEDTATDDAVT